MYVYKSADTYDSDHRSTMGDLKNRRAVIFNVSTQESYIFWVIYCMCVTFPTHWEVKELQGKQTRDVH